MKKGSIIIIYLTIFLFYQGPFLLIAQHDVNTSSADEPQNIYNDVHNREFILLMEDGKEAMGKWRLRYREVSNILTVIKDKINDPESDINTKLHPCITNALKKLYAPEFDPGTIQELLKAYKAFSKPKDLNIYVTIMKHPCPDDHGKYHVFADVKEKSALQPSNQPLPEEGYVSSKKTTVANSNGTVPGDPVDPGNYNSYSGVHYGIIRLYSTLFDKLDHCLEGILFHEILHLSCFSNKKNNLGEKIAYGCSHSVYNCAPYQYPGDNDADYSDKCNEITCLEEMEGRNDICVKFF